MKVLLKDKNYKKGSQLFSKGNYEKAIFEFNNALNIYKENPLVYANLGLCYANLGQFDKAIELFDKSLDINVNQAQVWDAKVTLLEKLGKTEDLESTMKKFDESVKANPELVGIKPLIEFKPPLPEGLKLYSLGNITKQPTKALIEQINYFLTLFRIPKQNVRFFYFKNELLIAVEEKIGAWMRSSFKNFKTVDFFSLIEKEEN